MNQKRRDRSTKEGHTEMIQAGTCEHGIPLDEGCVLCFDKEQAGRRQAERMTVFDMDVKRLVDFMLVYRDWATTDTLIYRLRERTDGTIAKRFNRTYIRHLVKASRGLIISGQRGHKATTMSTHGEIMAAAADLAKAAEGCMDRRREILFVHHHGRSKTEEERIRDGQETTEAPAGNAVCDEKLHDGTIQSEAS